MLSVTRPGPQLLVISERPTEVLLCLAIWIGVVFIFYLVVLGESALIGGRSNVNVAAGWHHWVLLLFPLFLLPYLFKLVRSLSRADELRFDGRSKMLSRKRRILVAFADIRELQLRTVHGTCEELRLSATLADGRNIKLIEIEASKAMMALAAEISELVGVEITRTA